MKNLILGILILSGYHSLAAQPYLYAKCDQEVKHPGNSNGAYLSKDCKSLFVLPPQEGVAEVNLSVTMPVTDCEILDTIVDSYLSSISFTQKQLEEINNSLDVVVDLEEQQKLLESKNALVRRLSKDLRELREEKGYYQSQEGGVAQAVFKSNWDVVMAQYQTLNPNLKVVELPVRRGIIETPDSKVYRNGDVDLRTVIEYSFAGAASSSVYLNEGKEFSEKYGDISSIFGKAVSGKMILSPFGICPKLDFSSGKLKSEYEEGELSVHFSPTAYYEYEVLSDVKYKATMNRHMIYKRFEESKVKRRFFSSKKIHKIIESMTDDEALSIEILSETSDHIIEEELKKEIRKTLVSKVLTQIAQPVTQDKLSHYNPDSGAVVAANELSKVCSHVYCKWGGFVLKSLDSIFGTGTNSSEIEKNFKRTYTETYLETSPVTRYSTSVFKAQLGN